jgi:copper transport protein
VHPCARGRGRWWRRASVAVVAAFVLIILGAAPASAHAQLQSSNPSPSSVLSVPPSQIVLHFGEPVEIDFGSIRVFGPLGNRVDQGGTHHPGGDNDAVAIALPPGLHDGTYVVAWRVISADSHPVHGAYIFSVGTARGATKANALAASENAATGSAIVGIAFWAIRFAAFVGLVLLIGIPTVILLAWRSGGATRRIGRLLWGSWVVLMLCTVSGIAVQGVYAAALPVTDIFRSSLFDEVLHTRFGEVEVLRVILLVAFLPVVRGIRGRLRATGRWSSWWVPYGAIVGFGLLLTPGLAGHASTEGSVAVGMALDVLHLGAAAVWCGGLAVLGAALAPGLRNQERPDDIVRVARTFSAYAFSAVVVIVATGTVQSVRQVGSFYALFNTVYGRTLLVKIGLVVVLIVLGAVSRRIVLGRWWPTLASSRRSGTSAPVLPPLSSPSSGSDLVPFARTEPDPMPDNSGAASTIAVAVAVNEQSGSGERELDRRLRRSVFAEVALALAVLAVTALLVNAVPAKQAASQPFSQSFNTLGVQVNVIVAPARTGPGNQFHFYVLGRQGQPVAIPELDAAISLPSESIGPITIPLVVAAPGHYRAADVTIPVAGDWILKLTVRTTALDEDVVTAVLPVR